MQVLQKSPRILTFDDVVQLSSDDMAAVDELISASLASDVALVSQVSEYIVLSGGKRLRPLIVLLAARALGYEGDHHIRTAAIVEFIHTATLLHDDVVDSSARRRGASAGWRTCPVAADWRRGTGTHRPGAARACVRAGGPVGAAGVRMT